MMRLRTVEMSVGLFMLAGFLCFVVLAFKVSGLSVNFSNSSYHLNAYFTNIGSLSSKARISMSGVTIGQVKSIVLDKKTLTAKVVMDIDSQFKDIPVDSTASILTAGLLGEQYISISPGGAVDSFKNDDQVEDTQSALILEDLIGKFLLNSVNNK